MMGKTMNTCLKTGKGKTAEAERIATKLASMSRSQLKGSLRSLKARFRMDFTEDYLNRTSVDRLRHILLAALINARPHN